MEASPTADKYLETLDFVVRFLHSEGFQAEEVLLREIESRYPPASSSECSPPPASHARHDEADVTSPSAAASRRSTADGGDGKPAPSTPTGPSSTSAADNGHAPAAAAAASISKGGLARQAAKAPGPAAPLPLERPPPSALRSAVQSPALASKQPLLPRQGSPQPVVRRDILVDEYDNADDAGYVRHDVSGQQRFVETQLDVSSDEGSEKYFMHAPGAAVEAAAEDTAASAAAAAAAPSGAAGQAEHEGEDEHEGSGRRSDASSPPTSPVKLGSAGGSASPSGAASPYTAASSARESPLEVSLFRRLDSASRGGGGSAGDTDGDAPSSPVLNAGPARSGDEVWDQGPADIKFGDPVVTPQKASKRDASPSRPVLSRVESLSSSFRDDDLERMSEYGTDEDRLGGERDMGDLSRQATTDPALLGDDADAAVDADAIDFSLLPAGGGVVGLDDIEAARRGMHGGLLDVWSPTSSVAGAAGSTTSGMYERGDSSSLGGDSVVGGRRSMAGGSAIGLSMLGGGGSASSSLSPFFAPANAGPSAPPPPGDSGGTTDLGGYAAAAAAAIAASTQRRKGKPSPMQTDPDCLDVHRGLASGAGSGGGGGGGGFSFPVTPPSEEPPARLFTSWASVRSGTSEFPGAEDEDSMVAEYADDDYSCFKAVSRSASMARADYSKQPSPLADTFTLFPSPSSAATTDFASPLLSAGPLSAPVLSSAAAAAATSAAGTVDAEFAPNTALPPPRQVPVSGDTSLPVPPVAEVQDVVRAVPAVDPPSSVSTSTAAVVPTVIAASGSGSSSAGGEGTGGEDGSSAPSSPALAPAARGGASAKSSPTNKPARPSPRGATVFGSSPASPTSPSDIGGVLSHVIALSADGHESDQFHSVGPSDDDEAGGIGEEVDEEEADEAEDDLGDGAARQTGQAAPAATLRLPQDEDGRAIGDAVDEAAAVADPMASSPGGGAMPRYSVDDQGVLMYEYDRAYIDRKYEIFDLRVIHRRQRTGFEESKDFPIRLNDLIAGRYQVMDFLGSAAFSRAVQALDIKTGTLVCLKIIKNNKDYFDQSLDEIKLLKYINDMDPQDEYGLVRLCDYFYYKEHLFLVCELLRANLYEFQKYNKESGDEPYFTNARIRRISVQVLRSLAFLHSLGLIHSDLKPENVLIKSYSRCEVKVIDLGSSCFVTDQLSSYVQSRSYRAPEVILGLPYDQKIDVWSLGCILAELSSGFVLFQNDSLATLLARLEGILGPLPQWMVRKGRYAGRFFTRSGAVYERSTTTERYELLTPKRTSLRHRVPDADEGLLDFIALLLTADPHARPTAASALRHPWLAQASVE